MMACVEQRMKVDYKPVGGTATTLDFTDQQVADALIADWMPSRPANVGSA